MERPNIGIVTFPVSEAGVIPLSNLVDIVNSLTSDLYLITGNTGYNFFKSRQTIHTLGVRHTPGSNRVTRILKYISTQLLISYKVASVSRNVGLLIFFIGGPSLLLPMLTAKLLRKRVVMALAGSDVQSIKAESSILTLPISFMVRLNLALSDSIILYGENLVGAYGLGKYRRKIFIAPKHFIDFNKFKVEKPLEKRDSVVGYIGRLSQEKGILNFMEAAVKVLEKEAGIAVLIGGDGQLRTRVEQYLSEHKLNSKVKFAGWIPHDELPKYLNELKLLVLPSYTEGLPNIVLEAMACGTPVLATPVGAIPDIIKDGETGFIMENNSPECIAANIVRAMNHPDLEKIARNARALVEREFTFEKAVERYRSILKSVAR
jgi:glycosyltransferase involved in cell wall biosynthesis